MMPPRAEPAYVEIVERTPQYDPDSDEPYEHLIRANEVRINGTPLLLSAEHPITVHDLSVPSDSLVSVTFTVLARRVVVGREQIDDA